MKTEQEIIRRIKAKIRLLNRHKPKPKSEWITPEYEFWRGQIKALEDILDEIEEYEWNL